MSSKLTAALRYDDNETLMEDDSTPIITEYPPYYDYEEQTVSNSYPTSSGAAGPPVRSSRTIILLLISTIFTLSFGGNLMELPSLRIYEDIICRHYYAELMGDGHFELRGDIDEGMCKGEEVQSQLNDLLAVLYFVGAIPALVMTVPYGLLADRIGRRPVFLLSITGMVMAGFYNFAIMYFWQTFPLRLIWLSPIFTLIGGGQGVTNVMFYAIGNDVTTEANRANMFMLGGGASILAEVISPSAASFLMRRTPWIPLLAGMTLLILGTTPIFWVPETFHLRSIPPSNASSERSSLSRKLSNFVTLVKSHTGDGLNRVLESVVVLNSLPILLLLISCIIRPFSIAGISLSVRYISKRFSWKFETVAFLLSLGSVVKLFLLVAIIPGISYILTERLHVSGKHKDLTIARMSAIFVFVGWLVMATSANIGLTIGGLVIMTLGTGYESVLRSLLTTLVDKEHVARLYSAIAVVEISSSLVASPVIAMLYSVGLKKNGLWITLPFYALSVICFLGGIGVWIFGFLKPAQREVPDEDDELEANVGDGQALRSELNSTGGGCLMDL